MTEREYDLQNNQEGKMLILTAGAILRNSCNVNGAGIMMAVRVTSGGLSGSGIDANFAFLALTNACGSSVFGGTCFVTEQVRSIFNIIIVYLILQPGCSQLD